MMMGECNGRYNTVEPSAKKSFWCIIRSQKICIDNIDVTQIVALFEEPQIVVKIRKTKKGSFEK